MAKSKIFLPPWELGREIVTDIEQIPDMAFRSRFHSFPTIDSFFFSRDKPVYGFVYKITFSDGTFYIGKKKFYSVRKVKKGKRELDAMTDKRGSRKKIVTKESDWKDYWGTIDNKDFVKEVEEGSIQIVRREIIAVVSTVQQLTYAEMKQQIIHCCIESEKSRNSNILGKFYKGKLLNFENEEDNEE